MYIAKRSTASTDAADPDISAQFTGVQIIDASAGGLFTATPAEFDDGLSVRCTPHSAPIVGICAQRRLAGREVVFGLEDEPPVDVLALEAGLTRGAVVIA
jgi:hypothetical protein